VRNLLTIVLVFVVVSVLFTATALLKLLAA